MFCANPFWGFSRAYTLACRYLVLRMIIWYIFPSLICCPRDSTWCWCRSSLLSPNILVVHNVIFQGSKQGSPGEIDEQTNRQFCKASAPTTFVTHQLEPEEPKNYSVLPTLGEEPLPDTWLAREAGTARRQQRGSMPHGDQNPRHHFVTVRCILNQE